MDKKLTQLLESYLDHFEVFSSDCLQIKDHFSAQIVPFKLNPGQKILHAIAEKQSKELGYVRMLLLKSRRFGGSTYIEGRFYWKTSLGFNRNTFIVGHELDSTDTLYQMATLFHERNPIKPATLKSNAKELVFDREDGKGLKSQYRLATAKNLSAGRSQGIHYLHDSEEAYWQNADILLPGLLACLPPPPAESECFRESTANGYGNRFQLDCFAAYSEGRFPYYQDPETQLPYAWETPGSEWVLAFIPWFVHDKYSLPFRDEKEREDFELEIKRKVFVKDTMTWEDSEASKLLVKFKLTLEQLHWRQWAIDNICNGRVEMFHQEYPSTVEEAFLSAGSNVYGAVLCDIVEKQCREPLVVGDVVDRMGETKIRPNVHGNFRVWEKPDPEFTYFITVDSAGGLKPSQVVEKRQPDPSCIDVYNHHTGVQAAQWHGNIDYDVIAEMVMMIGKMYSQRDVRGEYVNLPKACVEVNNHGYTVVSGLRERKYPMYEAKQGEPGWVTNKATKPQMVDGLYETTRDGVLQIRCKETVSEMRTFVDKGGKYEGEEGCHDERVMTAGMASQMMRILPKAMRDEVKRRDRRGSSNWDRRKRTKWDGKYTEVTP